MDFMRGWINDGRSFRSFNVIDDFNREDRGIEVDLSLPSTCVIRALDRIFEWRGKSKIIRCDNGPEYISQQLVGWAMKSQIRLHIHPGGNDSGRIFHSNLCEFLTTPWRGDGDESWM